MTTQTTGFVLTGRKVLAITVGAFAVIIGVNLVMAWYAVQTFPGLEVRNTYVASQGFNDRLRAQGALGWRTDADLTGGVLSVRITDRTGAPAPVETIEAILGRPTTERQDIRPALVYRDGAYVAEVEADYGNWDLRISAVALDGTPFAFRLGLIHR